MTQPNHHPIYKSKIMHTALPDTKYFFVDFAVYLDLYAKSCYCVVLEGFGYTPHPSLRTAYNCLPFVSPQGHSLK